MTTINRYRIYCNTEGVFRYYWASDSNSLQCPNSNLHSVLLSELCCSKVVIDVTRTNYNLQQYFHNVNTTTSPIIVKLPKASLSKDVTIILKRNLGSNNVTILGFQSDLIDGIGTKIISDSNVYELTSNGSSWASINLSTFSETKSQIINNANNSNNMYSDINKAITDLQSSINLSAFQNIGDLLVGDSSNSSILPVGSNDTILVADNTQDLGIKWSSLSPLLTSLYDRQVINSATTNSRTSNSYVDYPSISLTTTLSSGKYMIYFSGVGRISSTTGSNAGNIILNINGSDVTGTLTSLRSTNNINYCINWYASNLVSGSVIKIRWACSASSFTFTMINAILTIDGVSN